MPLGSAEPLSIESSNLVVANALRGDTDALLRSIFNPKSLSPEQSQTLAEQWGIADGPFGMIWRTATNPLFLIGALLSLRFPIPTIKNILRVSKKVAGYQKKIGKLAWVRAPDVALEGTRAGRSITGFGIARDEFARRHLTPIGKAFEKYRKDTGHYPSNLEGTRIAMKLDGLDDVAPVVYEAESAVGKALGIEHGKPWLRRGSIKLNKTEQALHDSIEVQFAKSREKDLFEFLSKDSDGQWITMQLRGGAGAGEKLKVPKKYWSRRTFVRTEAAFDEEIARMIGMTTDEMQAAGIKITSKTLRKGKLARDIDPSARARRDLTLPDPEGLRMIEKANPGTLVDPGLPDKLERFLAGPAGKTYHKYSHRLSPVLTDYYNKLAHTYAWHVKGHGKTILRDLQRFEAEGTRTADTLKARLLRNHYIPSMMGKRGFKDTVSGLVWEERLARVHKWLGRESVQKVLGPKFTKTLQEMVLADQGPLSAGRIKAGLAGRLYVGALGANLGATFQNLNQIVLAATLIGPRAAFVGVDRVRKGLRGYFRARRKGMQHEEALEFAWPQFAKSGLHGNPVTEEVLGDAMKRAFSGANTPEALATFGDKIKLVDRALMSFFTYSENAVRLVTFEGSMWKALREARRAGERGPGVIERARKLARTVTDRTQFLIGPESTPALINMGGPLERMFLRFPLRAFEYATRTATAAGGGAKGVVSTVFGDMPAAFQSGPFAGRNLGPAGRMMATMTAAYEIGKDTELDVSKSLGPEMFSPLSPEGAVGHPFPVPPFYSLLAGAAVDIGKGEFRNLKRSLPMLLPGGLAGARASTVIGPLLSEKAIPGQRAWGKEYVDYKQKTPDGKYAVFSRTGTLIGYFSPAQLFMKATGITRGGSTAARERELTSYLSRQADRIRGYRREWLDAWMRHDYRRAQQIEDEFEKVYPGQGGLQLKKSDIRAVQMRREIPRLEKVLENLPADMRPMFTKAIQTAMMAGGLDVLGIEQGALETGTAQQRMPLRPSSGQVPYQHLMSAARSQTSTGPPETIRPQRQPLPDIHPGFSAFQSYRGR